VSGVPMKNLMNRQQREDIKVPNHYEPTSRFTAGADLSSGAVPLVVIIGAGISGLTAAYRLSEMFKRRGKKINIKVIERSNKAGGVIDTQKISGALFERGPESFLSSKAAIMELIADLGLEQNLIESSATCRKTLIASRGRLHALPEGFVLFAPTSMSSMAFSPLFSWPGKMRMSLDLLIPKRKSGSDESLAHFVKRRLGQEALDRLAEPLISGIYSGTPEVLSASATVPTLHELEQEFGSVIGGLWARSRAAKQARPRAKQMKSAQAFAPNAEKNASGQPSAKLAARFLTFDKGMQLLVDALIARLPPDTIELSAPVRKISPGMSRRWQVRLIDNSAIDADAVIVATTAIQAAGLLDEVDAVLAKKLAAVPYNGAFVVNALFKRSDLPAEMNSSGFVVPRIENRVLRACTFSSLKFAGRSSQDTLAIRLYARDAAEPPQLLIAGMIKDLQEFLGFTAQPLLIEAVTHEKAMPQYAVGHAARLKELASLANAIPGLALAGNAYLGIGVPDCIASGDNAARKINDLLNLNRSALSTGVKYASA
jgi:protoporphyrinogen/coproporphyrinogen III oxidase